MLGDDRGGRRLVPPQSIFGHAIRDRLHLVRSEPLEPAAGSIPIVFSSGGNAASPFSSAADLSRGTGASRPPPPPRNQSPPTQSRPPGKRRRVAPGRGRRGRPAPCA